MAKRRRRSFSWKRALGVTQARRQIARATGIPTTKSGRKRKTRRLLFGWLRPSRRRRR
jgi:hypothetical protein